MAFLSTPPSRVATHCGGPLRPRTNVSIHATLAGGDAQGIDDSLADSGVSIHATLAGGDGRVLVDFVVVHVSIHATLAGGDLSVWLYGAAASKCFYPRHPRGWRHASIYNVFLSLCFYPRHPRGWRQVITMALFGGPSVSIHATLAGGDARSQSPVKTPRMFLSTPPSRVATGRWGLTGRCGRCFYPRHPRGWRRSGPQREIARG